MYVMPTGDLVISDGGTYKTFEIDKIKFKDDGKEATRVVMYLAQIDDNVVGNAVMASYHHHGHHYHRRGQPSH